MLSRRFTFAVLSFFRYLEAAPANCIYNMKELLWVNRPSLNNRAVDPQTGEQFGFDLIFRTTTLTLVASTLTEDKRLKRMTHELQQVLLNWRPLVKSANLLKINRFGAVQTRWFMLENNVDLSWYKNRFAVNSRNAVKIDTLMKVESPSKSPKAKKYVCFCIDRNWQTVAVAVAVAVADPSYIEYMYVLVPLHAVVVVGLCVVGLAIADFGFA